MIAICLMLLAAGARAEDKGGALPDVLIQAEDKRPVAREKPAFALDVKQDAPLAALMDTDDQVRFRIPAEIAKSTAFAPGNSNSPHVLAPSTQWIVAPWRGGPVRVFSPLADLIGVYPDARKEQKAKSKWELSVVDASGKVFRRFGGEGLPPERLEYDGKSDDGAWVRAGQVYTAVVTFRDARGLAHNAMGKPFAIAGLSLREPEPVITLAPRVLFSREPGTPKFSAPGAQLIREAAQLVQRHHPGLGIEVTAYLGSKDPERAQAAAELCAKDLTQRLLMAPGAVIAKAKPGTPDLEERVELKLVNR